MAQVPRKTRWRGANLGVHADGDREVRADVPDGQAADAP